jgi:hypothetical protein
MLADLKIANISWKLDQYYVWDAVNKDSSWFLLGLLICYSENSAVVHLCKPGTFGHLSLQIQKKINPNLKRDYQFLSKEMWIVEPIGLITRERFLKPVLKLDFTAHGIMKSLSEFGLCGLLEWGGTFLLRCGIGTVCINIQQQAASDT